MLVVIIQENSSEPIQNQQIKEDMQEIEMQEHVGNQGPGLKQKPTDPCRQFEIQQSLKVITRQKKEQMNDSEQKEYGQICID
jgi:hypothetical protein